MICKQIDLQISVEYEEVMMEMTDSVRRAHVGESVEESGTPADQRDWRVIAKITQDATDTRLVEKAAEWARTEGALVVANDEGHVQKLVNLLCRQHGVRAGVFDQRADSAFNAIVITKRHCRGYNEAVRLGSLVTGVYAGNGADRHQLLGRLRRLGQKRPKIWHVTVMMKYSVLAALYHRHQSVDTMNMSLESLGQKYGREILDGLQ